GLVLGDRLAEGLALLRVAHRELERANPDPARARRHVDPADLDAVHHLKKAQPRRPAENVIGTGPVAVENQLGGVDALVAQLVDLARNTQAGNDFTEA